jgi:hypothetical protein
MSFGKWREVRVQEDRNVRVAAAHFRHEPAQRDDRGRQFRRLAFHDDVFGIRQQLVVVDRQDKARRAARLLRERSQVAVARQPEHFRAFFLDSFGQSPDAGTRDVLGAKIFVDDDDGKTKLHGRFSKKNDRCILQRSPGVAGGSVRCGRHVLGNVTPC